MRLVGKTGLVSAITPIVAALCLSAGEARADVAATHVYHNHMPNFWAYYDTAAYAATPVGSPIRYTFDGYVIELKKSPPANYTYYLPDGRPMPHDDLVSYYSHHAKTGAYMDWPWQTAQGNHDRFPLSQTQVTMSAAVINNVFSLNLLGNVAGYNNTSWNNPWRQAFTNVLTTNGFRALDLVHITGHHTMGPLVGRDYLEKELIFHNATMAQPHFLGDSFRSSKGFFPTELGFSDRLVPVLAKLGINWSVVANLHFSRTLADYPYLNDPGIDTMVSPPNRADLRNSSSAGSWVMKQMFNEKQVTYNKFPFAATPHWVRYVDPATGRESRIAAIPVEQASSWEEAYQGSITAAMIKPFESQTNRKLYFVIAHDGDNSSGRAGDGGTWANSGNVTYSDSGVTGMGIDEYLKANPIPQDDVAHVQDGSWIDTRDSSADPTWYHWHLPPCIWKGQFSDFNRVQGTTFEPKKNLDGVVEGNTVSLEYGYHYLERNFALLQAAENFARTAEQIWLDAHPSYWSPVSDLDRQVTYAGNQLNPWMMAAPVKGDPANDYAGGANPAELGWYFLMPAMDSGFGYYDENQDDHLKPTLSMNQSLYFTEPYVQAHLSSDRTGPSIWWPQRWPYNPGSANVGKAEGWTLHYFDNQFAIYTYGYDVSGISEIKVKVRVHKSKTAEVGDNTYRVYDPEALAAEGVPNIDPSRVGPWVEIPMQRRDLTPVMNGVDWQAPNKATMAIVPATRIGDLYYAYIKSYRDQLVDYYVEAVDARGNVTRSDIQQVYVGAGRYRLEGSKRVEDINGTIKGTYPFVTDVVPQKKVTLYVESDSGQAALEARLPGGTWSAPATLPSAEAPEKYYLAALAYPASVSGIEVRYSTGTAGVYYPSAAGILVTQGTWTLNRAGTLTAGLLPGTPAKVYYRSTWNPPYIHYRPAAGTWTTPPGVAMKTSPYSGYFTYGVDLGSATQLEAVFNNGASTWDNNGGRNYLFPPGVSTLSGSTITPGFPPGICAGCTEQECGDFLDNDQDGAVDCADEDCSTAASCGSSGQAYFWVVGSFGACTRPCGGGVQTRTVKCQDGAGIDVADALCTNVKPVAEQACNPAACVWSAGTWSACPEADCDGLFSTRAVQCATEAGTVVADTYCDAGARPVTQTACDASTCEPVDPGDGTDGGDGQDGDDPDNGGNGDNGGGGGGGGGNGGFDAQSSGSGGPGCQAVAAQPVAGVLSVLLVMAMAALRRVRRERR